MAASLGRSDGNPRQSGLQLVAVGSHLFPLPLQPCFKRSFVVRPDPPPAAPCSCSDAPCSVAKNSLIFLTSKAATMTPRLSVCGLLLPVERRPLWQTPCKSPC